jgi:hypothetical protein
MSYEAREDQHAEVVAGYRAEVVRLSDENKRLRLALEILAGRKPGNYVAMTGSRVVELFAAEAREVLKED